MGDHRFDGVVGDLSKTAIRARVSEIDRQLSTIGAVAIRRSDFVQDIPSKRCNHRASGCG